MLFLIISLAILWIVPWLILKLHPLKSKISRIEVWFTAVTIGLILIGFLPQQWHEDGWLSLLYLLAAALVFRLIEHGVFRRTSQQSKLRSLIFLGIALLIHAFFDGLGLAMVSVQSDRTDPIPLGVAIITHRIPASMGIWNFLQPRFGSRVPALMLMLIGIGTIIGYLLGQWQSLWHHYEEHPHLLEYLIAGGLLHYGSHVMLPKHQHLDPNNEKS